MTRRSVPGQPLLLAQQRSAMAALNRRLRLALQALTAARRAWLAAAFPDVRIFNQVLQSSDLLKLLF